MNGYFVMRWWPGLFAAGWVVFARYTTTPVLFGGETFGHILAGVGAALLAWLAVQPERMHLRISATVVAVAFPLFRFLSLAWEPGNLYGAQRIVAMTAWALLAITLLILYPSVWYEGYKREHGNDER